MKKYIELIINSYDENGNKYIITRCGNLIINEIEISIEQTRDNLFSIITGFKPEQITKFKLIDIIHTCEKNEFNKCIRIIYECDIAKIPLEFPYEYSTCDKYEQLKKRDKYLWMK